MANFRELRVWKKSHELTLEVYRETAKFPRHELYGLTHQLRTCSASIPANIAEGSGRMSDGELGRFFRISLGSASELEYHLLLAKDLGFLVEEGYQRLNQAALEIQRMLASFLQTIASNQVAKGEKPGARS